MDFWINKNATLPILKMELVKDGRNDYHKLFDMIQNSRITFCMTDLATGIKVIGNKEALCVLKHDNNDTLHEEYYIGYKFTSKDTKKAGTFVGEFTINFDDGLISEPQCINDSTANGTLIVPIREELFIHVLEGSIRK